MLQFLCFFFPAFISVAILNFLENKERSALSFLTAYAAFATAINMMIIFVLVIIFKDGQDVFTSTYFILAFALKFLALALVFAVILPYLFVYLKRNIQIRISVKEFDKR